MKFKFSIALVVFLVVVSIGYDACAEISSSGTWRYKMTVTVETPEGLKTGSAVREVTVNLAPEIGGVITGPRAFIKGEAVVVDMGQRGVLFAPLVGDFAGPDYGYMIVFQTFAGPPGMASEGIKYYVHLKDAKAILPPERYPLFVNFKDLKNPKSLEKVEPQNFAATFGSGVSLKSVEIEMTDENVIFEIEKWLPWLSEVINLPGSLGGGPDKPSEDPTGLFLTGVDFSRDHTSKGAD